MVKNIGDSLMVHVKLEADGLPDFLLKILKKKAELDTIRATGDDEAGRQLRVPIRIVIIHLDPLEFLHGQSIDWSLKDTEYEAEVPSRRAAGCTSWLCGDLFGSNIALAFRASGIPKDDIVVIDDRIIRKWKSNASNDAFDHGAELQTLRFGPRLAFSPFKGLEDIYNFGGEGPVNGSSWESHLFLRMVGTGDDKVGYAPDNKLVLDQQKVRIFTEIAWEGQPPDEDYATLLEVLKKKQKGADYVRSFGRVLTSWDSPKETLSHNAGMVLMGAYPNPEAYAVIRRELDSFCDQKAVKYAYPVTNEVYASPQEMLSAFWVPDMLGPKYLLFFGRWRTSDRRNDAQIAKTKLKCAIEGISAKDKIRVVRCGLLQGNLWDVYGLFAFFDHTAPFGAAEVQELSRKIQQGAFAAGTLKLCGEVG